MDIHVSNVIVGDGEYIRYVYNHPNIKSSLSGHPSIQWYADNPDSVKLVVAENDIGEPVGRALLWTTEQGIQVMDNIYCGKSNSVWNALWKWAWTNDIFFLGSISQYEEMPFYSVRMDLPLDIEANNRPWPYLDFFQFAHVTVNNDVILETIPTPRTTMQLDSHDGDFSFYPETEDKVYRAYLWVQTALAAGVDFDRMVQHVKRGYPTADDVELSSVPLTTDTPTCPTHKTPMTERTQSLTSTAFKVDCNARRTI